MTPSETLAAVVAELNTQLELANKALAQAVFDIKTTEAAHPVGKAESDRIWMRNLDANRDWHEAKHRVELCRNLLKLATR